MPENVDIVREKTFDSVVAATTFTDDDRVAKQVNDAIFGLVAYVFSENPTKALSTVEALESGVIAVNRGLLSDPSVLFGDVRQLDLGCERGFTNTDELLEEKLIPLEG